jgi:spore coat protein U-like protein
MPMNRARCALRRFALCGLLASGAATAAPLCSVSATPLIFGNYDPLSGSAVLVSATVTVSCLTALGPLAAIPYTVSLGPSQTSGTMLRSMAGPLGARLQYNLYTSAARSVVWGDGSGGSQTLPGSVTPASLGVPVVQPHTVHGSVPALQSVRVGAYADGILVTVDY